MQHVSRKVFERRVREWEVVFEENAFGTVEVRDTRTNKRKTFKVEPRR